MAAHSCLCALILVSLFTLRGFVSGSEYSSFSNYIYAEPKDMGNDSNWHSLIFRAHICIVHSTYKVKLKKPLSAYICACLLNYFW